MPGSKFQAARDIEDEKPVRARLSEVMNIDACCPAMRPADP